MIDIESISSLKMHGLHDLCYHVITLEKSGLEATGPGSWNIVSMGSFGWLDFMGTKIEKRFEKRVPVQISSRTLVQSIREGLGYATMLGA